MSFTKLKLTTFGTTLETKWRQGKGVHFTRVAIGDGLLGNGSMINRTALINERHSILIDGIVATDDAAQAAVIATLDNKDLTEGFLYRELALMAKDPDTGLEGVYLYDNAGQECEFLDTQNNGVVIYERIKILIRSEQTENISFEASGNPLYLTTEDMTAQLKTKADLGEDGKVVPEQLPDVDIQEPIAGLDLKDDLADNDGLVLTDSTAKNGTKRILWSRIKGLMNTLYAAKNHGHTARDISDFPSAMPPTSHKHGAGDINSGILGVDRIPDLDASKITFGIMDAPRLPTIAVNKGGTGAGTAAEARQNLGAACTPAGVLVTFPVAGWTALEGGGHTQTVTAAGLLSTDDKRTATVCSVGSTDKEAQALTDAAYNLVDRWSCDADGFLTARCPEGAPEVEFQAYVVIVR